jgi:alginate O-acetyltransferase complex protein AlgI
VEPALQVFRPGTFCQLFPAADCRAYGWLVLFTFLIFTWVLFRVENSSKAFEMVLSMTQLPPLSLQQMGEIHWDNLLIALLFATVGPSSTVLAMKSLPAKKFYALGLGLLLTYLIVQGSYAAKEFIYFQF